VDLNWGEDEPAPKIVFDEIGSRHHATAEAIKTLIDAGALSPDDGVEEQLRNAYSLPPSQGEGRARRRCARADRDVAEDLPGGRSGDHQARGSR
jgi:hypothetical protein